METDFQYLDKNDLLSKFGDINFRDLLGSCFSYSITSAESVKITSVNIFTGNSVDDYEFGFSLNFNSLKEAVKDYEFYGSRGRFNSQD